MSFIASSLLEVKLKVANAARDAGRDPEGVALMAVSKTWPVEIVREAVDAPHRCFGENKVQEGIVKVPALPEDIEWHLIGLLQKNKIRKALPLFSVIHSIDSIKLARQVDRVAGELSLCPRIFLQVNLAGEETKGGFSAETLREHVEEVARMQNIELVGLMTIPTFSPDPEVTRPHFRKVRELRDAVEADCDLTLPELSMGMSHDFEVAIQEGATIVRVGTGIFGKRQQKSTV